MGLLTSNLSRLRNDPRLFRLPPYLALLCILGGLVWVALLPLDEYSRRTYISENALLPGQVHTYFAGSEQNIFRAYRHEIAGVLEPRSIDDEHGNPTGRYLVATDEHRNNKIVSILHDAGIKTARQTYTYEASGKVYTGENVYAIVHGPRADGTESIVLVAPIKNIEDQFNVNGVTLLITLARYFSRWSLWSKDIIILVTPDSTAGPKAFVDAYHSMHDPARVADLTLKSGHIQGVVVIDYPFNHRFESLHVAYDGINGQLPNLDLINTAIQISTGQMGIGTTIQGQHRFVSPKDHAKYPIRLQTLARGMLQQALGKSTGAHSVFIPYHIDAITLTAIGDGWQDEMAFGRVVESVTRSINNLLEKLHQSFFFFLLLQNTRFVSIGTYLPSAMAIGAGFSIVAMFAWISSGYEIKMIEEESETSSLAIGKQPGDPQTKISRKKVVWTPIDRPLALPLAVLAVIHLIALSSVNFLAKAQADSLVSWATSMSFVVAVFPAFVVLAVHQQALQPSSSRGPSRQAWIVQVYTLLKSLSLLILGLELTVLATLNFSLSMFLGLLCSPAAFVGYNTGSSKSLLKMLQNIFSLLALLITFPPLTTLIIATAELYYFAPYRAPIGIIGRIREYLADETFTSAVLGGWSTDVGVWGIWVPAWIIAMSGVIGSFLSQADDSATTAGIHQSSTRITPTTPTTGGRSKTIARIENERERSRSGSRTRTSRQSQLKSERSTTTSPAGNRTGSRQRK